MTMFNPAMMGISPQQMEQAQEVGRHLRMEITTYKREGRMEVKYILANPDEPVDLGRFIEQLCQQLMYGHKTMFGITGKIRDVE